MEPRIQYATTSDGVSVAFFEIGEGGEIVVANVVRKLTAGKGFLFSDRDHALRGFEDPVRVWELRWA